MALPLILAGPILRRVDQNSISVWVATRDSVNVRLRVWEGPQFASTTVGEVIVPNTQPQNAPVLVGETNRNTLQFGSNLHIVVVTLDFTDPNRGGAPTDPGSKILTPGTEYAYNLVLDDIHDLREQDLLSDGNPAATGGADAPTHLALGYTQNLLPGFLTPPANLQDLVISQASCRKTSAGGDDAMSYLDEQIQQTVSGTGGMRPHQLFLTGDQIYADDVAAPLLPRITALASELLGVDEELRMGGAEDPQASSAPARVALTAESFPTLGRQRLFFVTGQMTSHEADCHLMGFGEYAAMYLLAWSGAVWDDTAKELPSPGVEPPPPPEAPNRDPRCTRFAKDKQGYQTDIAAKKTELKALKSNTPEHKAKQAELDLLELTLDDLETIEGLWKKGVRVLQGYRNGVPRMRRLLANVATYMVFDDHEVTDDWSITQDWKQRVMAHAFGRTIFRNALSAFALFQGWGNDPDAWNNAPADRNVLAQTAALVSSNFHDDAIDALNTTFGLAPNGLPLINWHFSIQFPAHVVVALDTRNHRQFDSPYAPPGLLTDQQIQTQVPLLPAGPNQPLLLLISPAPLLAPPLIDHIGLPLAYPVLDAIMVSKFDPKHRARPRGQDPIAFTGQTFVDTEAWAVHDGQFEAFLDHISAYRRVLSLSGDVHYGCAFALDYWRPTEQADPVSRIVQFTSSGARNKWPSLVRALFGSIHTLDGLLEAGTPAERLRWIEREDTGAPFNSPVQNGLLAPHVLRSQLYREPVIVPTHGWPDSAQEDPQQPPDTAWRLHMAVDTRPDFSSGDANSRPEQTSPPAPPNPRVNEARFVEYVRAMDRHAAAFDTGDPRRRLVWEHNSAIIDFQLQNGEFTTRSHNLGRNPKADQRSQWAEVLTLQAADFALSNDDRPSIG